MMQESTISVAGFWSRLWAWALDLLLFALLVTSVLSLVYGPGYFDNPGMFAGTVDLLVNLVIFPALVVAFWWRWAASPGKMIGSLVIVDARTGGPPTALQCFIRLVGLAISVLPLGAGLFWILVDRRRRGWHDMLARTLVVDRLAEQVGMPPRQEACELPGREDQAVRRLRNRVAFRWGATLLLVAAAADGFHRFTRKDEITAPGSSPTETMLREAGLLHPVMDEVSFLLTTGTILLAAGIGLLLVWRADERPEARALALLLGLHFFSGRALTSLGVDPDVARFAGTVTNWLAVAALLRFVALFPRRLRAHELVPRNRPHLPGPIQRTFLRLREALIRSRPTLRHGKAGDVDPWAARVASLTLSPAVVWGGMASVALVVPFVPEALRFPVILALVGLLVWALVLLWLNYRGAGEGDRRRSLWVFLGFGLSLGVPLALALVSVAALTFLAVGRELMGLPGEVYAGGADLSSHVAWVNYHLTAEFSEPVIVILVTVGVVYRGAIDPGLAIRKTTIYGAIGMVPLVVFAAVEHVLSTWIARIAALPGVVSAVVAAGVSAGVFGLTRKPIRRYAGAALDRLLLPGPARSSGDRPARAILEASIAPNETGGEDPRNALALASILSGESVSAAEGADGRLLASEAERAVLELPDPARAIEAVLALSDAVRGRARSVQLPPIQIRGAVYLMAGDARVEASEMGEGGEAVEELLASARVDELVMSSQAAALAESAQRVPLGGDVREDSGPSA